jgi:predicted helicase
VARCLGIAEPDRSGALQRADRHHPLTQAASDATDSAPAQGLGHRSAIDWVLDQHKERKSKDPTIREKFDTCRFADHKERVIDLLARVVRVGVETLRIVDELKAGPLS